MALTLTPGYEYNEGNDRVDDLARQVLSVVFIESVIFLRSKKSGGTSQDSDGQSIILNSQ